MAQKDLRRVSFNHDALFKHRRLRRKTSLNQSSHPFAALFFAKRKRIKGGTIFPFDMALRSLSRDLNEKSRVFLFATVNYLVWRDPARIFAKRVLIIIIGSLRLRATFVTMDDHFRFRT